MPAALENLFGALRRSAVGGLRTLLVVSMVLFAAQPTGALAARPMMNSHGAAVAISGQHAFAPQAVATQAHEAGCCQPASGQAACPDCAAVSCTATPVTLAAAATLRIARKPLRHVFSDRAFVLSAHSLPPEPGPPRT